MKRKSIVSVVTMLCTEKHKTFLGFEGFRDWSGEKVWPQGDSSMHKLYGAMLWGLLSEKSLIVEDYPEAIGIVPTQKGEKAWELPG